MLPDVLVLLRAVPLVALVRLRVVLLVPVVVITVALPSALVLLLAAPVLLSRRRRRWSGIGARAGVGAGVGWKSQGPALVLASELATALV